MNIVAKSAAVVASTAIALSGLAACGSSSDSSTAQPKTSPTSSSKTEPSPSSSPTSSSSTESSPSSSPTETAAAPSASATITIKDYAYKAPDSVKPGTEIMVKNDDSVAHTVTADSKSDFDVTVQPGETKMITAPSSAGSYKFHCTFHSNMHGTLKVG